MLYHIWLQNALSSSSFKLKQLLTLTTAKNAFMSKRDALILYGLFTEKELAKLLNKNLDAARKILKSCEKHGIKIITYESAEYPALLREIPDPPAVLYTLGNTELLNNEPCICIVGPRKVSVYGNKAAFSLSARLAAGGMTVVSGGATGSDAAAHRGALAVGGNTIAVLGCGINTNYLMQNKPLRDEIAKKGLLISEFPPDYPAFPHNFPIRNRIMSGLSLGTVVVEAADNSGSLITANTANEQGRDVFVIPGSPTLPQYKGSNALLRDGAKPLLEVNDVLFEYLGAYPHKISPEAAKNAVVKMNDTRKTAEKPQSQSVKTEIKQDQQKIIKKNITTGLSKQAQIVYNYLDKQIFFAEEINNSGLTDNEILSALTELEILGFIEALPGGRYALK